MTVKRIIFFKLALLFCFICFFRDVLAGCEISMKMVLIDSFGNAKANFRRPAVIQNGEEHIVFINVSNCGYEGVEGEINFGDAKKWVKCLERQPGWKAPSCVMNHRWDLRREKVVISYRNGRLRKDWEVPVFTVIFEEKRLSKKEKKILIDDFGMEGYSFSNEYPFSISRIEFNKESIWGRFKESEVKLVVNRRKYTVAYCGYYKRWYCLFDVKEPVPASWKKEKKLVVGLIGLPKVEKDEYFWMRVGVYKFIKGDELVPYFGNNLTFYP